MRKDTIGLIKDVMDFMEENLKSEIEISELSKRAAFLNSKIFLDKLTVSHI